MIRFSVYQKGKPPQQAELSLFVLYWLFYIFDEGWVGKAQSSREGAHVDIVSVRLRLVGGVDIMYFKFYILLVGLESMVEMRWW